MGWLIASLYVSLYVVSVWGLWGVLICGECWGAVGCVGRLPLLWLIASLYVSLYVVGVWGLWGVCGVRRTPTVAELLIAIGQSRPYMCPYMCCDLIYGA